ncbi:FkbM family methyltransferase [Candidatus Gracilibacteria bacterium]|nr:FkbM family methyltransferase [Candidatus Gracilibacteria bacterium]
MNSNELDKHYSEAHDAIVNNNLYVAESVLNKCLRTNPRAAQTLYLFGVVHVLLMNVEFGLSCIRKSYEIKTWVRDDVSDFPKVMDFVLNSDLKAEWINYTQLRYQWLTTRLDYDFIINKLVSEKETRFIEIGANDGISGDPLFKHVNNGGMSGIFIEPLIEQFEQLKNNYGDLVSDNKFLNIAVSSEAGELELFYDSKSTHTSATPQRNVLKHSKSLKSLKVPKKTLMQIFEEENINHLDILQIDTEGHEWEILKSFDLQKNEISVIYIEFYCLLLQERIGIMNKLNDAGYVYYFDGMNLLAVKKDQFEDVIIASRYSKNT